MSLIITAPTEKYDRNDQAQMRRALMSEDLRNFKRGGDIEVENGRVIIRSPNGSRFYLVVSDAGALSTVAL